MSQKADCNLQSGLKMRHGIAWQVASKRNASINFILI